MKFVILSLTLLTPLLAHASEPELLPQPVAQRRNDAASDQITSRVCYEQKIAEFRLKNGE